MRWQRPAASCSAMSWCRHGTASGLRADGCGPLSTACCSCWRVHGGPQVTGHPFVAYSARRAEAGCCRAWPEGCMRLFWLYLRCAVVNGFGGCGGRGVGSVGWWGW